MKKASVVVYAIFGAVAISIGLGALIAPGAIEPEATEASNMAHLLREQGAATIFLGLMSFWCIFNFDRRRIVHAFLTLFALLMAGIHWFDYLAGRRPLLSGLLNSVPVGIFLAMLVLNRRATNA
ncbi:MAG: DUF4345 family protein [Pyrinomonadaceae bacterium]